MAATGSVAFNFERRGRIELPAVVEEDPIIEAALEADVDDVEVQVRKLGCGMWGVVSAGVWYVVCGR